MIGIYCATYKIYLDYVRKHHLNMINYKYISDLSNIAGCRFEEVWILKNPFFNVDDSILTYLKSHNTIIKYID